MAKPLTSPEERVALFQKLFSDTIPHNKALGLKVVAVAKGLASMQLDWRSELVGNPETGVVHNVVHNNRAFACFSVPYGATRVIEVF